MSEIDSKDVKPFNDEKYTDGIPNDPRFQMRCWCGRLQRLVYGKNEDIYYQCTGCNIVGEDNCECDYESDK